MVRLTDKGSKPQCVRLMIEGVPAYGVIDSGADITIMGGVLFKKVAAVTKLRNRDLKRPDKTPRNYNNTPFTLHGQIDLNVTFNDQEMRTPVYVKTDAHEQLLLSEGVCRQLGILQYHPDVEPWRGGKKQKQNPPRPTESRNQSNPRATTRNADEEAQPSPKDDVAGVPTVRVRLL